MTAKRDESEIRRVSEEELIQEMHRTVDLLAADNADRGDLKLLSRVMRELRYSFRILSGLRGHRKVTVFGSARVPPGSASYNQAVAFGQEMARRDWYVVSGAGESIMEAAHIGAGPDRSVGINILLPFEQPDNPAIAGNPRLIHVKYFFSRKLLFVKETDGIALFPGGFGTMDEAFEVLTLLQTGKSQIFPVVLVDERGGTYWRNWDKFVKDHLLGRGLISSEDLSFFRITDDVWEAVREITGFYRVYHSMRYVGPDLVVRVARPFPEKIAAILDDKFSDLLREGLFRLGSALPEEEDEPEIANLPRLIFPFNRKSFGRLRQLIDYLNRTATA